MADEVEEVETPKVSLGIVQIVIIVVLMGATQIGVAFVLDIIKPPAPIIVTQGEPAAPEKKDLKPANYLPLDPALVVNFQHEGTGRFLQTNIQVMTRNTEVLENARTHSPAIRAALISLFGNMDYDRVMAPGGKEELQAEALEVANTVIAELAGGEGLDALYMTSFVIQ